MKSVVLLKEITFLKSFSLNNKIQNDLRKFFYNKNFNKKNLHTKITFRWNEINLSKKDYNKIFGVINAYCKNIYNDKPNFSYFSYLSSTEKNVYDEKEKYNDNKDTKTSNKSKYNTTYEKSIKNVEENVNIQNNKNIDTYEHNALHVNNICKKIYYMSKNNIKNEKEWNHYLLEFYKETENYKYLKIKSIFMLLLGLTKSKEHIKEIFIIKDAEKNKKIHIIDIVNNHISILSKKFDEMTNNQLSIFLYIIQKWNKIEEYKEIINRINDKLLKKISLKKLNIRSFSNILHIYSKNYENFHDIYSNNMQNKQKCIITNDILIRYINKISKEKFHMEDILLILSSMYKLKIKNNNIFQSVIQILNVNIKDDNYFLIPSLLLSLANLNIYNEELYLKLKNIIMQNYYFYNSVHLTNIYYSFSKFKPNYVEELFDKLSIHIIQNFVKKKGKENMKIPKETINEPVSTNLLKRPLISDRQINNQKFNIFQITNILNSCIKCNYLNYDFFLHLILDVEKINEKQSLDNIINYFYVISEILRTFHICSFKYKLYLHNETKQYESIDENQFNKINNKEEKKKKLNNNYNNDNKYNTLYILNKEWKHNEIYWYNTSYNLYNNNFFFVEFKNVNIKKNNLQNKFELYWDDISKKIIKIIEKKLYDKNIKYVLHNLMLCLSLSEIKLLNLYILCLVIIRENFEFFSISNLYLYLKILHKFRIYNYEIFHLIFNHIKKYMHLVELRKQIKIILLYFNIFKKADKHEMELISKYFLNLNENSKIKNEKESFLKNDEFKQNMWKLPTDIKMKQNFINLDNLENSSFHNNKSNNLNNINTNDNINLNNGIKSNNNSLNKYNYTIDNLNFTNDIKNNSNNLYNDTLFNSSYAFDENKNEDLNLINDNFFFKKIEKTEIFPSNLNFCNYLNILLILILNFKNIYENIKLNTLISKDDNLIKIKEGDNILEKYTEMLKENLINAKFSIIQFFTKFTDYLEKEKNELYNYQTMYILDFLKTINENIYMDLIKIEKMKKYDPYLQTNSINSSKKIFELKKEDFIFINSTVNKNFTFNDILNDHYINHRYQFKSINEAINNFSSFIKTYKYKETDILISKNKYSFKKIKTFYKLNRFLTSDILLILEKNNDEFFYFIIFYPYELKRTVVNIKEDTFFFNYEYDESFLINIEILFIYNFLKKKYSKNFFLSIIDATQFIKFSKNVDEIMKKNRLNENSFNSYSGNKEYYILENILKT
ncbi:conserved Plasmodium protein, unknown function [Plasmodium gallinaceum]|uniref:Uncharacterized protein n=1 Tax=Plasmodium gallinaceum TaxID=5849 RepID=A0A1J1GSA3_PLAGA|nr:conserved Plasmodium protein, unknown function [Plasmodium gallinaceum]CRG95377.1 conserved Plasmodium protein, unknown function [Plasmodium gallinaceum]